MADEPATAPEEVQDSPTPEAPETPDSPQADETDWEQRYKDTQAEYTRQQQQLSEFRERDEALKDPGKALEILRDHYGYEIPEEDDELDDEDLEDQPLDPRVDVLLEERQRAMQYAQEQQAEQARNDHLDEQFDQLEEQLGRPLNSKENKDEFEAVLKLALESPDEQGLPDVLGAHKALEALVEARRQEWIGSKKGSAVGSGAAAVEKIDKSDPKQREEWMNSRFDELNA